MTAALAIRCQCGMPKIEMHAGSTQCVHCDVGCMFCDSFQYHLCERNQEYNTYMNAKHQFELMPLTGGIMMQI